MNSNMMDYAIQKAPLYNDKELHTEKALNNKIVSCNNVNWANVKSININTYPWSQSGKKQSTQVKLIATDSHLLLQFTAQDKHSSSSQTELNHMLICEDSCVEFFFSPSGVLGSSYVNLEVNCCGTFHIAYGENRNNRQFISAKNASLITCHSSINQNTKTESPDDKQWLVEMTLPFAVIEQLAGEKINKSHWYGNFYRCGGKTEPQFAVWQSINTPYPDFHQPEYFGKLIFE